ncbi:MAG TPA: 5'-nucleotidase C-terminal domain-containing protein, partial [Ardenticatenaceae bacterium]|nr:5'-nucleotidase C-terminal domain-containing protein [Ardenticatenaceae bacterium]
SNRLSNLTKGAAIHRLLGAAGCDAAAVGNAALPRYGPQVLAEHATAARYPLLLANVRTRDGAPLAGVQLTSLFALDTIQVGIIGVTAPVDSYSAPFDLQLLPPLAIVRELAAALRQDGADVVILLSHLGLEADRELAAGLQEDVALIVGGHSHDLLPEGERLGRVWIVQAGAFAEHLGRVDLAWNGQHFEIERARVAAVPQETPLASAVTREVAAIEREVNRFLGDVVGELAQPLDFATDRECGVANLMADVLRERMGAEVAVVAAGQAFTGPLPAGPLRRVTLWDACPSPANPGVVAMAGAQFRALVARGLDPEFAADRPAPLRGQARGLIHLSGALVRDGELLVDGQPLDPERVYRVAGSDWEFEGYGGYADPTWQLQPRYDVPIILRETLEVYLAAHRPVRVAMERLSTLRA